MSFSTHKPEIAALKRCVEEQFGLSLQTHNSFISLADAIGEKLREHISESTLERLWCYSTRMSSAISVRTLDVLSRYCGHQTWAVFTESLKGSTESEEFSVIGGIQADELQSGVRLRLGWLPDRLVTVRKEADQRFVVEESVNSSLRPGDSFACGWFQKGRPLYLDHFRRCGSADEARYVAGERSGLTTLEKLLP